MFINKDNITANENAISSNLSNINTNKDNVSANLAKINDIENNIPKRYLKIYIHNILFYDKKNSNRFS